MRAFLWLWLDALCFGSGYGMGAPFFAQIFYYQDSQFYTWVGGLGAQLRSFQWRHPIAGTERQVGKHKCVVFNSSRRWLRVQVSWRLVALDAAQSLDEEWGIIRGVKKELFS